MSKKRSITIIYESDVPNDLWEDMVNEIVEAAEQAACDYAAGQDDDTYNLEVYATYNMFYEKSEK